MSFQNNLLLAPVKAVGQMPLGFLHRVSDLLAFIAYNVVRYRKSTVFQNISKSFPDYNNKEVKKVSRQFYKGFTDMFLETTKLYAGNEKTVKNMVNYTGLNKIDELTDQNKTVIIVMGHVGNWEMLSTMSPMLKHPLHIAYRPLSSKVIEKYMFDMRSRFGITMLPSRKLARHLIKNRKNPGSYVLISDQCPTRKSTKYTTEFLNQPTSFFDGFIKLSQGVKAAVVYLGTHRTQRGKYEVDCRVLTEDAASLSDLELGKLYVKALEQDIRQWPDQWLWSHKRWKRV